MHNVSYKKAILEEKIANRSDGGSKGSAEISKEERNENCIDKLLGVRKEAWYVRTGTVRSLFNMWWVKKDRN